MSSYIGNSPQSGVFRKLDALTFNGSTTTFNITCGGVSTPVGDVSQLFISLNGVIQEPGAAFTLASGGTQIVFSAAPTNGMSFFGVLLGVKGAPTVDDGQITATKLAPNAITTSAIADDAVTSDKIGSDIAFTGGSIRVPTGTTEQRPASPATGMLRYNTTVAVLEQYTADGWVGIEPAPTISTITYPNSQTAVWQGDTVTINGTGFKSGVTAKFLNPSSGVVTTADSTTRISSTQVQAVFPTSISTEGTYSVVVTNPSGLGATLDNVLAVDSTPIWNTAAGSLGAIYANEAMTPIVLSAIEDSVNPVFTLHSGSLPTGLSLSSSGTINGTPADVAAETVYNFTLKITDVENQISTRAFSLTVYENYQQTGSTVFG